jgi:hypothetical protein
MPSFTGQIPNLQQVGPVVEVTLTPSLLYLQTLNIPLTPQRMVKVLAMIDTGATGTVIQQGIAQRLGLNPVSDTNMTTPSHANSRRLQYDVQLVLPNNVNIGSVLVTEAPLQNQHIQCLIGRDILQHGVLIYIGYSNSFTLSF